LSSTPSKPERLEKRLLTSRWRSPTFSSSRARRTLWRRPASPLQQSDASAVRASASAACAASSVDRLVAGTSTPAPGTCPSPASAALGEGGAGSYLSGGSALHRFLPPLPPSTTSTPRSPEGRVPAVRASGILCPSVPSAPAAGSFAPSCAPLAPAPAVAPRVRAWARGVGRSDRAAFTATLCWKE
jgi:hypothetical protein